VPLRTRSPSWSRDTVRRAIQTLREIGLVETRRGIGNVVPEQPGIQELVLAPGSRSVTRLPTPDKEGSVGSLSMSSPSRGTSLGSRAGQDHARRP